MVMIFASGVESKYKRVLCVQELIGEWNIKIRFWRAFVENDGGRNIPKYT
jgi:hypothetical protein